MQKYENNNENNNDNKNKLYFQFKTCSPIIFLQSKSCKDHSFSH